MKDLNRLDFRVDLQHRYRPGCFVTSTTVLEDGNLLEQWIFEENFIDTNHSVAVCKEVSCSQTTIAFRCPLRGIEFTLEYRMIRQKWPSCTLRRVTSGEH